MSRKHTLHVVQVMAGIEEGGLEKHLLELSRGLSSSVQVSVIAHSRYRERFPPDIHFESVDLSKNRNNPVLLYRLARSLKRLNPDIIHAQGGKAASVVAKIKSLTSAWLVATVHGLKKKQRFLQKFDHVIGVSEAVTRSIPNPNRSVIYNGITLPERPQPGKAQRPARKIRPTFLAVGRLVPVKGFDVLLDAWEQVDGDLMIAGEGPERTRLEQKIARSAHLSERVKLLGFRQDIPALITSSDCVLISSYREGFSYVVAEALLLERPVLSTNVPVANEILDKQYLCATGDSQALANLINRHLPSLAPGSNALQTQFQPCFEWARSHLLLENMVEKTISLYEQIVESRQSKR